MIERPHLARFARRSLGAVAVPTQTLLAPRLSAAQLTPSGVPLLPPDAQRAQTAVMRAAAEPYLAPLRERAAMFGWDKSWAKEARWTDARLCFTRDEVIPLDVLHARGDRCEGDPVCNWGFYQVQAPCDDSTFARVQFQWERYAWAQAQLGYHLAHKPSQRAPQYAQAWTQWTLEVMRLVSLARWSTNISDDYYPLGERAQAKMAAIVAGLHPSYATPSKLHARDVGVANARYCLSLWLPRNFNNIRRPYGEELPIPKHSAAFDPVRQFTFDSAVPIGTSMSGSSIATWPWRWIPRSPGADLVAQMRAWFEKTLGAGYWYSDASALVSYVTREGCGPSAEAANYCTRQARAKFSWGTATATIELVEAMAEDIVQQSYGQAVAAGLTSWLDQYQALPPEFQILGPRGADLIRAAADEIMRFAVHSASALLSLLGTASMGFTTVVAAVLSALTEVLIALKAAAIGGGLLETVCLACPVVRSIPVPDVEGLVACDFDTRTAGRDVEEVVRVVNRLNAVRGAAAAGLPVSAWLEASRDAERGNIAEFMVPPFELPPPGGEKEIPWLGLGVAGAVLLGGVLLLQRQT